MFRVISPLKAQYLSISWFQYLFHNALWDRSLVRCFLGGGQLPCLVAHLKNIAVWLPNWVDGNMYREEFCTPCLSLEGLRIKSSQSIGSGVFYHTNG